MLSETGPGPGSGTGSGSGQLLVVPSSDHRLPPELFRLLLVLFINGFYCTQ